MTKKYSEDFEKIFNFTRRISKICGVDVIKENFKINWNTAFVFVLVNLAIIFSFYTNYVEVFVKENHINLLKSYSVLGSGFQGYVKLINVLVQRDNFSFLYKEITDMYKTYEQKSIAYKKCLKASISLVKKLLFTVLSIISLSITVFIGMPVIMLAALNTRVEILPVLLPFIDYETDFGFYFTSVVHVTCVFFAGFGNLVIDSWLFVYVAHIPLIKNILKCKFDDLDAILEENPRDVTKSRDLLNDILKWHQKYIKFCDTIKSTFFWVIFVQIGTEFFGIVCTIVCIFLGIWPTAPIFLFYLLAMVYAYCSLGNLVEVANDDIIVMIYDSCWYNLTVTEQKMILLMLRESQQASGISIGGVAPLSLNTALQMTKTIYTLSMMLKEFLN